MKKKKHLDEEEALLQSHASNNDAYNLKYPNARITTQPTTITTTTQAATSNTRNSRGLIQKRAHTLDDFMEGNKKKNYKKKNIMSQRSDAKDSKMY